MVSHPSLLIALVHLVDAIPLPPSPPQRGHPKIYSDRVSVGVVTSSTLIEHLISLGPDPDLYYMPTYRFVVNADGTLVVSQSGYRIACNG